VLPKIDTLLTTDEIKLFEATGSFSGYEYSEQKGSVLVITTKRIIVLIPWGKKGTELLLVL
jgi:hypothetical protein